MSIGVRVSVLILGAAVVISAALAVWGLLQRQSLLGQNQNLRGTISSAQNQLAELNTKANGLEQKVEDLNTKIAQAQQDKAQLQSQFDDIKQKSTDLQSQLDQANSDRDDWKNRVTTLTQERDQLVQKLKNQPVKIVYKDRPVPAAAPAAPADNGTPAAAPNAGPQGGDYYTASILKQKAALQIELARAKSDLDQAALQVVDLKKQNSDLQLQVKQITNEKDEIVQKIKYGQDLADNLSIDLARSRSDQEAVNERADKLKQENLQLLAQLREVNSTKLQLEQTVSRLNGDKEVMQKKLTETQSVIQNRIDDIWKIKQSLDRKLSENAPSTSTPGSMELPPIIVNAPQGEGAQSQPQSVATAAPVVSGKAEGSIISINEPNNFVIVDLGQQNSQVSIGNALKVYRDSNPIASLEVIQVRRDICAADIKNKSTDLKVGDVVRFY